MTRPAPQAAPAGALHSVLYMPASNRRAIEKARSLKADAIILDLEDAVAPAMKAAARGAMREVLGPEGLLAGLRVILRINGLDTDFGIEDVAALADAPYWPEAVLIPKVSGADDLLRARKVLSQAGAPAELALWAMIETPAGLLNLREIVMSAPETGLTCLVVGANDIAKETRLRVGPGRATLLPLLSSIVVAARAGNLAALDAVYNVIGDTEGFAAECAQGRDLGFDGKTVIHPSQIAPAKAAFAPSAEEIAEAEAIIAAFALPENAGAGAISLEGRMVERLHLVMAERILSER
ncbi:MULTISPECIES: CoA ester lyase [unclassified Chelatococcus]|uniref:HpcH/HpaI aldolase/citrate lyase family protein n=1 Tax=unclassified Chelatococcus TaxID=2638111 RepID=UPI001BCC90C8|nr:MULTISPECIES: CoA ester lyase [unclassified Chelatococcus]MBS7697257.1 CoA ester lyase [Chelatococcus sp. YT9]MBX3556446.1 CoA ester lyase [Chelatococcus sp.]